MAKSSSGQKGTLGVSNSCFEVITLIRLSLKGNEIFYRRTGSTINLKIIWIAIPEVKSHTLLSFDIYEKN